MLDNLKKRFQQPLWLSNRKLLQLVLKRIDQLEKCMNTAAQNLSDQVARDTTVVQSAVTLIQGLKTQLDAAIGAQDWAQVQALSDQLGSNTDALANAVAANTPGGPVVPPSDGSNPNATANSINR